MEADQKFVEMVVKAIVEVPDGVKTERAIDEMGVLITLSVDPSDMGKIIGKEGRTAKAIRTLLRVIGAKNNARVNLKISEPEGAPERKSKEFISEEDVSNSADEVEAEKEEKPAKKTKTEPVEEETETPTEVV